MLKQLAIASFLFLAACSAPADDVSTGSTTRTPLAQPVAQPTAVTGDWRARVRVETAALRNTEPALYAELSQLAPSQTRAGFLRFTSKAIHDPRAASVFLDRLIGGRESEQVRAALVEALPRTGGTYSDAAADLIATETSAMVRAAFVHSVRRAPAEHAVIVIERALGDSDATVTAEAARAAAAHPEGAQVADKLRGALASPDATTRAEAARSLGILKIESARDALLLRLNDASADVRLEALRAVDRIAPGSLKGNAVLEAMTTDTDPRIVQLVARISGRAATVAPTP